MEIKKILGIMGHGKETTLKDVENAEKLGKLITKMDGFFLQEEKTRKGNRVYK